MKRLVWASREVEETDLLELASARPGAAAFYLERCGAGGLALAGLGSAAVLEASGPERFRQMERQARLLFCRMVPDESAPAVAAPRLVGGFAFRDSRPGWRGFPAARLVLPALQAVRTDGRTWLTAAAEARPGEREVEVRARLSAALLWPGRSMGAALPAVRAAGGEMPGSWRRRVGEAQAALRAGRLHKVVLARAARFEAEAPVPWPALAEGLRSSQEGCLVYSFAAPEGSAFVGATPELLVRRSGRRAWSCALAGSAPRSCRQAEDRRFAEQLARSAKEQGEHAFVAEAVCDALRAAGAVTEIGRPAVVQLAHVQHIETRIEAELRADTHILELAGRLHPTPAVAGAPRSAALEFLERHEPLDRGWYSGAAGWVEAGGDGELSVALRCARVEGTRLWAYAGAGIVEASEAESEWAETEIKLRAIVSLLKVQP